MEPLPDPCHDRKVKALSPPPNRPLAEDILFPFSSGPNKDKPSIDSLSAHLRREGKIAKP